VDEQQDVGALRDQIEETRSSLTEKLETLETEVKDTVSSVAETVQDATDTVKRNLDLEYQVRQHPWAMMGLSLLSGLALGAFLGGRSHRGSRLARRMSEAAVEPPAGSPARTGFMDKLTDKLGDEFERAKDLAVTTLAGVVRDVAQRSIPALGAAVEDMMAHAAAQCASPPQQYGEQRQ